MERSTHTLAVKSQKWLVQALLSIIQKKPYEEITISELCKKAGLDRRTFYRNFKDKNDVLFYHFSELQEEYLLKLNAMQEHTFHSLAYLYFDFWTVHLDFFKTAQREQTLNIILLQVVNTFIPTVYASGDECISRQLEYNIAFVIGGFHNVLVQWIEFGFQETAEEMAAIVSEMFKDTISYWPALDYKTTP